MTRWQKCSNCGQYFNENLGEWMVRTYVPDTREGDKKKIPPFVCDSCRETKPIAKPEEPLVQCSRCHKLLPMSDFSNCGTKRNKKQSNCRKCNTELTIKWQMRNPHYQWAYHSLYNHKKRGMTVNISLEELVVLARSTTHCPMCGTEIDWERGKRQKPRANSPSLDRKYNGPRMTLQNTWIICNGCNTVKNNRPLPEFVEYCSMIVNKFSERE